MPVDGVEAWLARHLQAGRDLALSVERAMAGGFAADRPGYAFASGLHEALRRLLPGLPADRVAALCASEEGGAHPRAIETRLSTEGVLQGRKQWITLGTRAEILVVIASVGQDDRGRNRLAAVQIPADRTGVTREAMPAPPFVPEIPHAVVRFEGVRVEADERLAGDGYADLLRPFRTVEDIHVTAAIWGWILGVARRWAWPRPALERAAVVLTALRGLAQADPGHPATHVALGGVLALGEPEEGLWERTDEATRGRWLRDRALLQVAGRARARRLERAWERLGGVDT